MRRLSNYLRREWPTLILATMLVALTSSALMAARGPRDLMLLRERRAQLEAQRAELIERKTELETNVQNLRSNDRFVEHIIRKELGYVRSDELVYKFTGPNASANATVRTASDAPLIGHARKQSVLAGLALQLLSEFGMR